MQTPVPVYTGPPSTEMKWFKTRTAISGILLLVLAVFYIAIVLPVASAYTSPANYRFPFSFEANIYVAVLGLLAIHWLYRLIKRGSVPMRNHPVERMEVLGMFLRGAFVLCVGGSYFTGTMIATPEVFAPLLPVSIVGISVPIFANYIHSIFAALLIGLGIAIVVYELVRIAIHKGTLREWLVSARYRENKILYWIFGIAVIIQGTLGLFLLGTISPIGPFGLIGSNSYAFETLVRHIHGPWGAVLISLFFAQVYFRARPEFRIS